MPREVIVLAPRPLTARDIATVGRDIDPLLGIRAIADGNAVQLVDDEDGAVLTLENSRRIDVLDDVVRVLGPDHGSEVGWWWIEGSAPWGDRGVRGTVFARRLADLLGGRIRVEDGA